MRKMFFLILIITTISFFYFAQLPSARADEAGTFVGTIESFPCGFGQFKSGPPLWPVGMIVVNADNGEKSNFLIVRDGPSATIFYDADGKVVPVMNNIKGMKDIRAIIGKRVEVKYAVTAETMRYANKQLAISVRYVSADYVQQPAAPSAQAGSNPASSVTAASEAKIFIGTVKDVTAVLGKEPNWTYNRIKVSADSGDKTDFFVMRRTVITDSGGADLSGKRIQKGKRVEIKYSTLTDSSYIINGQKGADSMRYVPEDYAAQPTASITSTHVPAAQATGQGNVFIGTIDRLFSLDSMVRVVPDNGGQYMYFKLKEAALTDVDGKAIFWESLAKGQRVEVKYSQIIGTGASGAKTAQAVLLRTIPNDYIPADYAQQPTMPVSSTQPATAAGQGSVFIGKVEQVTPTFFHGLGPRTQPRSKILVTADSGEQMLFFVPGTCPVTDASGKAMGDSNYHGSLKLRKGQRIEVKYSIITNGNSITNGQNGADSICCLD